MSKRVDDPVGVEMYVNHVRSMRERKPVEYVRPPNGEKWKAHAGAALSTLSGSAKAVAYALIEHANTDTGRCDPSVARLCLGTCLPKRTVQRALCELRMAGFISTLRRGRNAGGRATNAYQIEWAALEVICNLYVGRLASIERNVGKAPKVAAKG
jgi:hypothetical protein